MDRKWIYVLSAVGVIALFLLFVIAPMKISVYNENVSLTTQATAQEKANQVTFDTVWKIINQQAQVAEKYKDQFKDVYAGIMSERQYGKGGSLFKWITEHNPQFDPSLMIVVSNSIEAQRMRFEMGQRKLVDIKREHDKLRMTFPSNLFMSGVPEMKIAIVLSDKTEQIFKTGKDNNVKVF